MRMIALGFLLFATVVVSQAKDWRGIVPLHSTRTEVEKLLGPPKNPSNQLATYKTESGMVTVMYASGNQTGTKLGSVGHEAAPHYE